MRLPTSFRFCLLLGLFLGWGLAICGHASAQSESDLPPVVAPGELLEPLTVWPEAAPTTNAPAGDLDWLGSTRVGYDSGFVIASDREVSLGSDDSPFLLRFNGWGQLRQTNFESLGTTADRRLFQLQRGRLVFSGHAFNPDFNYFIQLDGRSTSGDDIRLLDYRLNYDFGHQRLGLERGRFAFRTGRWKMPFNLARDLSGREFEFSDRSVASMFFDVNRSLAWGFHGKTRGARPIHWETAIFNGLVTGGAETGSAGTLDNNYAYSGRLEWYPVGDWGKAEIADLECHSCLAIRLGAGFANSTIDDFGTTEFNRVRVVDSGQTLADLFIAQNLDVDQYTVNMWAVDASAKYAGWSLTGEYYFRLINGIQGDPVPDLYDHGFWLQTGKFVVPEQFQLIARWSRVVGDSGTLGTAQQSSDEIAAGAVWYFRGQAAKFVVDATYLDGAPISSAALDIFPGDRGWLYRSQIQFAF